jgi:two-component system, NarL family, response regulator NreC
MPNGMATTKCTVLIADDHAIVKEGLVSLLEQYGLDVVAAVGDGQELLDAARRLRPDVIVTDVSMPGLSGLDVLARLKAERLDSRVIVLTMHNDADLATRVIRAGAAAFLLKNSAGEELLTAIRQAMAGRTYLTPTLTREVIERMSAPADQSEPQLTTRQREVLRLILDGRRMKEIAVALNLSTRTVETHKYQMMETLGVTSTAELVKYAVEHRLLLG